MRARVLSQTLGNLHVDPMPSSIHRLFCRMGGTRKASVTHAFYKLGSMHGVTPSVQCTGTTKVVSRYSLYVARSPVRAIRCCAGVTVRLVRLKTSRVYVGSVTNVNHPRSLKRVMTGVGTGRPRVPIRCRDRTNPKFGITSVLRMYGTNYSCVSINVRPLS